MADEKIVEKQPEVSADKPAEKAAEKGGKSSLLPWIIIGAVVVVSAGAGLGLGRLLAKNNKAEPAVAEPAEPEIEQAAEASKGHGGEDKHNAGAKSSVSKAGDWYYELEPVVANLDEPGATRYVRAAFTLEMSREAGAEKGTAFLEEKKPLLKNVLTIYLAGLNVETTRGDKNLKRIQSEVCDLFNEKLYPNSKPLIKGILIKEFAVQ